MNDSRANRRGFLKGSAAALAGAVFADATPSGAAAEAAAKPRPIRLGAPVFGAPEDPEGIALAHTKLGYRAAYCPSVRLDDKDRIRDIEKAFAKHDVAIAEVGRWVNLLDADPKRRAALPGDVPLMVEHMQGAEEYDRSRRHLFEVGKQIGVRFE